MENTGHEMLSISKSPAPTGLLRQTELSTHKGTELLQMCRKISAMIFRLGAVRWQLPQESATASWSRMGA